MFPKLRKIFAPIAITLAGAFFPNSGSAAGPVTAAAGPHFAVLHPTTNAPADSLGFAWLGLSAAAIGIDSNLHVSAEGLFGGVYTVSVTDRATNSYVLGTITSPFFTNPVYADTASLPSTAPSPPIAFPITSGVFSLPDGLAATNLLGISIADSNAVVDLVGDFLPPTNIVHHEFHEGIFLAATNDAPPRSTGRAELDESDATGTNIAMVTVDAEGLFAGTYTVDLTDRTGTNTFVLGDLTVSPGTDVPGFAHPDFIIFGGTNTSGHAEFPLPAGLDASNAVTISVVDSNAVTELVGDFTNPTNTFHCGFKSLVPVFGGPICTNLHGSAGLDVSVSKGRAHNKFSLVAQGAPPSRKLTLFVNGVSVGQTKSTKQGKITLKKLPQGIDLMGVMTLEADDSAGNVIFTVDF